MRKRLMLLPILALVAGGFSTLGASAHACQDKNDPSTCEETPVVPNWRDGNYIPLFDITDRDDPQQRHDAQRWRDECDNGRYDSPDYQSRQLCAWAYGGTSGLPDRGADPTDPNSYRPNEFHAGFAATHCFLGEAQHQCEDHEASRGEGLHDAHGGAIWADVCVTKNSESKYCDDGMTDTQVGVTIMDHNGCGVIVPIAACTDEYHVIRPFDAEYTQEQMEDSAEYMGRIADDPELYLCGKPEYRGSGNPICPGSGGGSGGGDALVAAPATGTTARAAMAPATAEFLRAAQAVAGGPVVDSATLAALHTRTAPTGGASAPVALLAIAGLGLVLGARRFGMAR